jgi:hypothetical protein
VAITYLVAALAAASVPNKVQPTLTRPAGVEYRFDGEIGRRLRANLENWELRAPHANPAMLHMFYDRDRKPDRGLLPWSGEFAGKYLCSSMLSFRILRDPRQKQLIDSVVKRFIESQGPDGYLGPFDRAHRLVGKNWDIWGHYWAIRALLLYHEEFGSEEALRAATRAADLLVGTYLDKNLRMTNDGSYGEMNHAVIHAFTMLYRVTAKPEYLRMARWIVEEWDRPGAGRYMRNALAGKEMFEFPGRRWESMHDFLGMQDLYLLTGEEDLGKVFRHIWYSILKGDRHNTGGFTSGEATTGNPYDQSAIETCCTVAWIDVSAEMLKLTGNSLVADELELSTFNGMIGGQHPSGRWWTYNTPMNGEKRASAHDINFQCRSGSPELNCCSVNGPRGLGLVSEWAVLRSDDGVVLNYYGPSTLRIDTPGGQRLALEQETNYPSDGRILLRTGLARPERFPLLLRIPSWSRSTSVQVNGEGLPAKPGTYLTLAREWKDGDRVEIRFDMSPHFWVGERQLDGWVSAYHGPLLLAFDPAFNSIDVEEIPDLDARGFELRPVTADAAIQPWVLFAVKAVNGAEVRLCDFATAGAFGNSYRSWLVIRNLEPARFHPERPVWNNRPGVAGRLE